jgi:hypothetical protein
MDSSYCVQINVSVRRDIIVDITIHDIYTKKGGCIVLLQCVQHKAINRYIKVDVDISKGVIRFREKHYIKNMLFLFNSYFHLVIWLTSSMTTRSILVRVCFCVPFFYNWRLFRGSLHYGPRAMTMKF